NGRLLKAPRRLLNFCFLELDVLTRDGIIFLENELFRRGPRIFLCDVEKSSASRGQQLDLLRNGLRHGGCLRRKSRQKLFGDGGRNIRAKLYMSRWRQGRSAVDRGAPKAAGMESRGRLFV